MIQVIGVVLFVAHALRLAQAAYNGEDVFLAFWVGLIAFGVGFVLPAVVRPTRGMYWLASVLQVAVLGNAFAKGFHLYQQEAVVTLLVYGYAGLILTLGSIFCPRKREKEEPIPES